MERQKLSSKILASIGYDPATKDLEVEFRARKEEDNRRVYRYHAVPAEKVTEMMASESKGSYFLKMIRPNYQCTRIEETHGKKEEGSQIPPAV
jgi:KTSC domain-containing protein